MSDGGFVGSWHSFSPRPDHLPEAGLYRVHISLSFDVPADNKESAVIVTEREITPMLERIAKTDPEDWGLWQSGADDAESVTYLEQIAIAKERAAMIHDEDKPWTQLNFVDWCANCGNLGEERPAE